MPRNRRIPSYRYHNASNQAVVVLDGKSFYLGPWDSQECRAEYDRLIGEWLATGRRTPEPTGSAPVLTVSELILAYWTHAQSYYVKDGCQTNKVDTIRQAMCPVREFYGNTIASQIRRATSGRASVDAPST